MRWYINRVDLLDLIFVDLRISESDLAGIDEKFDNVVAQRMCSMVTFKGPLWYFQLVVVEKLFKEACFRVFIKLGCHIVSSWETPTCLALSVDLNRLFGICSLVRQGIACHLSGTFLAMVSLTLRLGLWLLVNLVLRLYSDLDLSISMVNFLGVQMFFESTMLSVTLFLRRGCKLLEVST